MTAAPNLRSDLSFIEQVYSGETSYVVKDLATQRYFRFGQTEVRVMRAFDGRRTPQEIASLLVENGMRISARAIEQFARKLASAGFFERTMAERSTLQMERLRAERRARRQLFRGELLRMRWSFGDPDALLARTLPSIRWMFTRAFLAVSVVLFALYFVVLGQRWPDYTSALQSTYSLNVLTLGHVAVFLVTALVIVLIHELGHAFTCKYFGGEVHELGFMLLYFQPAFYCNVSDAWSFPERRARIWVTAAGSWIQLVVAALAAIVWAAAAPGTLVAEVCAAAMLVGGAMTLLTNMNPLLPLDGYFALCDWLDIPNLRHRASAHVGWWIQRTIFRLELSEPAASPRERRVFLIYGALAAVYTTLTLALFAWFVLGWVRQAIGGLGALAIAAAALFVVRSELVVWTRNALLAVRAHRATRRRRLGSTRARVLFVGALVAGFVTPWTLTSSGAFVVQPATSRIVTPTDTGVVAQVLVSEGMLVSAGAPIVQLVDHAALRAPIGGTVLTPRPENLVGRRVGPGDSLLVLAALDSVEVRIALGNAGATRVRAGQVAHVVSYANAAAPRTGRVRDVSAASVGASELPGGVEARVRMVPGVAWRPGMRGEARIEVGRSTVFGALWSSLRQWVRTDLWL